MDWRQGRGIRLGWLMSGDVFGQLGFVINGNYIYVLFTDNPDNEVM